MTPAAFVTKWKSSTLTESAASQAQFIDLCRLLGEDAPADVDPKGAWYAFEKGATKATGNDGWADVWKRDHFAWEYKGKGRNLDAAFAQLQQYAGALGNPPLLVVSDMHRFRIHTAWTNTVSIVHELTLDDLIDADKRKILKWVLSEPERLRPTLTRQSLTEEAATKFAGIAQRLRRRGEDAQRVAHFVNRLVFCMFAEDVDLLPNKMFTRLLKASTANPAGFADHARMLFSNMHSGGIVGFEPVDQFNGGLFNDSDAIDLDSDDIKEVVEAAAMDWSDIDPSILGTLFERGLDPDKRSQLGAHYTDRDKIMLILEPVIVRPLIAEWEAKKQELAVLMARVDGTKDAGARTKARNKAIQVYGAFLGRLRGFTVLDPACGSGNFLYLALLALKDIEHRVSVEAEVLGLAREFPQIGPESVRGIELNPYAAELARVTVWIGEIQWARRNGYAVRKNPILRALETIENRDALLNDDGTEASWPKADVITGNPPFLGDKRMKGAMGADYVGRLRRRFRGRVPGAANLVLYWFEKARMAMKEGTTTRFGLVSTNAIRQKVNRKVVEAIRERFEIFDAWSDQKWINDGADVNVSIVCVRREPGVDVRLDGNTVAAVSSDLRALSLGEGQDFTTASRLQENLGNSFFGLCLAGSFAIPGKTARRWLIESNPNGRPNSDVVRPLINGKDVTGRTADRWVVDFGIELSEDEAALYQEPFEHVLAKVKPKRQLNGRSGRAKYWWRHGETRPGMRARLAGLERYICTPERSKHRFFVTFPAAVAPEHRLVVLPYESDLMLGILSSRFHVAWALRMGSTLQDRPGYNTRVCFDTFPFPDGLTPNIPALIQANHPHAMAISAAAKQLTARREAWLNPPDLIEPIPEVVAGFPNRLVPKSEAAAALLKDRTLTNLYNSRPAWLENVHRALDTAVAAAYGWPASIPDDDALRALLKLNQQRAVEVRSSTISTDGK